MLSTTVLCFFLLVLPDLDLMHFISFLLLVKRLQKNWFVLATGMAENLTQVVFRQPFVVQHARPRSLNCKT